MDDNLLSDAYEAMEGSEVSLAYSARHGIASAAVLTITDDETADMVAESLAPRVAGKAVVEIGGGIGLLALHLGFRAKRVFCIEANPVWASFFAATLLAAKPKNVSYLFGAADEFAGYIRADVALFCTHSGVESMRAAAALFAPVVIDVYGEIIAGNPSRFDPLARALRPHA
jgi:tRNA G37 N-methylase Trm5